MAWRRVLRGHSVYPSNLPFALKMPEIVSAKLQKELVSGRVAGQFESPLFDDLVVKPIGAVSKKSPGDIHVIHCLSHPAGLYQLTMGSQEKILHTVDDAIAFIRSWGGGCFLAKPDTKSAFIISLACTEIIHNCMTGV